MLGPPGTGKTSYVARQVGNAVAKYGSDKVVVMSLTRTAAREAAGRVELPKGSVGTMHSFAYHALGMPEIAELHLDEWNATHAPFTLTTNAKVSDDMSGQAEPTTPQTHGDVLYQLLGLFRAELRNPRIWPTEVASFAKQWEEWKADLGVMDFADLIEKPVTLRTRPLQDPRVLFVDEAQDLSAAENQLLRFWGEGAASIVVVGDPDQALYVWRGADPDKIFEWPHRQVLSQSYRVPGSIVKVAREWLARAPGYTAVEYQPRKNKDGEVVPGHVHLEEGKWGASYQQPEWVVDSAIGAAESGRTTMIQASCGYMLYGIINLLRKRGVPFHNPWRPQQGAWNPLGKRDGVTTPQRLLAFLRPSKKWFGEEARFWTAADLRAWGTALRAGGVFVHGGKAALKALPEKATQQEVLAFITKWFEPEARAAIGALSVDWWLEHLEKAKSELGAYAMRVLRVADDVKVFDEEPKIILGTIHSLKGSEADVVYLFPDISPSGADDYNSGDAGLLATHRLFYVGMTRARESLVLCAPSNAAQTVLF